MLAERAADETGGTAEAGKFHDQPISSGRFQSQSQMVFRSHFAYSLLFLGFTAHAQDPPELTVDMIMQNPDTWIGAWPTDVFWTDGGEFVYFRWNPQGQFESDSLFKAPVDRGEAGQ